MILKNKLNAGIYSTKYVYTDIELHQINENDELIKKSRQ